MTDRIPPDDLAALRVAVADPSKNPIRWTDQVVRRLIAEIDAARASEDAATRSCDAAHRRLVELEREKADAARASRPEPGADRCEHDWQMVAAHPRVCRRCGSVEARPEPGADLAGALDETTRMLAYLWDAEGLVDGFAVRHSFPDGDPLHEGIPRVLDNARRALAALPASLAPKEPTDG